MLKDKVWVAQSHATFVTKFYPAKPIEKFSEVELANDIRGVLIDYDPETHNAWIQPIYEEDG